MGTGENARSVTAVIEDIGYGPSQVLTGFLVNGAWLADGSELLILSAIASSLGAEWKLTGMEQGSLMSAVYFGVLVGNLISGVVGDRYGRRSAVLLCFPVITVCSLASALAQNFWQLLLLRFLVGLGFGAGQPSAVAILMEVSPLRYRTLNQGLAQIAFAAGELYCCAILWLDDPTMEKLHWRPLLVSGAVPAVVFWGLSWLLLDESPVFTAATGQLEKAKAVLDRMRHRNGKDVCTELSRSADPVAASTQQSSLQQARALVSWTSAALCLVCFSYNFTIYGAFTAFPKLIPKLTKSSGSSAVAELATGALIEVPADLLGLLAGLMMPRKWVLLVYFVGFGISCSLFAMCKTTSFIMLGYYGIKAFPQIGSISLYVLAAESYPVEVRATGTAAVLSVGRIGAFLAPILYAWMEEKTGHHQPFFNGSAILMLACAVVAQLLIPETFAGHAPLASTKADERIPLALEAKLSHGTLDQGVTA